MIFSTAKKAMILVVAAGMMLAGCSTTDPYTGERQTSNTTRGAVIGGLLGAAVGALTNTSSGEQAARNALIGAGVGALAGGGVGAYMDRQEARLRERLARTGVGIRRVGNTIELVMPGNITFNTDQSAIRSNFYPVLDDVALVLDEFDSTYVIVEGHTDSTGSDQYNQTLSQERANSVASYMISRQIMPQRLIVRGFGESQPIASNATPQGREQNRRVEIRIEPLTR